MPGVVRRGVGADAAGAGHAGRQGRARAQDAARPGRSSATHATVRRRAHEHHRQERHQALRQLRGARRRQPRRARRRAAGAARARPARARRRCCASSPGWRSPTRAPCSTTTRTSRDRSARDRNVGFVFQHYALFRHMTVFENVAFGLRVRKRPKSEVRERVRELLHLVRLEGLERRYPSQLSGGQRQRVALARALAARAEGAAARRAVRRARRQGAAGAARSGCAGCTTRSTSPACSSRTIRKRRSKWPTAWW